MISDRKQNREVRQADPRLEPTQAPFVDSCNLRKSFLTQAALNPKFTDSCRKVVRRNFYHLIDKGINARYTNSSLGALKSL